MDDIGSAIKNVSSAAACQELCNSNADCKHFTYGSTVYSGNCWLKSKKVTPLTSAPGLISGPKTCANCIEVDGKYMPLDMPGQKRTVTDSASACQDRCLNTEGCSYFSWWNDGGCHLQDSSAKLTSGVGANVHYGPNLVLQFQNVRNAPRHKIVMKYETGGRVWLPTILEPIMQVPAVGVETNVETTMFVNLLYG